MTASSQSGGRLFVVTPDDDNDLPCGVTDAVYVSVAGTLQVSDESGAIVPFPNAIAGWHPIRVSRIWNTNTAATGIIAMRLV